MKKQQSESVLHDWVAELPFAQQTTLLLSLRCFDGLLHHGPAKDMVHLIRGLVLKPLNTDFVRSDSFMSIDYDEFQFQTKHFFISGIPTVNCQLSTSIVNILSLPLKINHGLQNWLRC